MPAPKPRPRQPISDWHKVSTSMLSGLARVTTDHIKETLEAEGGNSEDLIVFGELMLVYILLAYEPLDPAVDGSDERGVLKVMADNAAKLIEGAKALGLHTKLKSESKPSPDPDHDGELI